MNKGCLTRVVLLPLAVIAVAVVLGMLIVKSKPETEKKVAEKFVAAVDVVTTKSTSVKASLTANGTVKPARRVQLSPQVQGRVNYVADALVVGGRVTKGQALVRIESRDYSLAVEQEKIRVDEAKIQLTLEQGRGSVAKREASLLGKEAGELVLRLPQLRSAQNKVKGAESALEKARLNFGRATLRAPFNGLVLSENVEPGAVIGMGSQVATIIGTDAFWVEASIPVEKLKFVKVPQDGQKGSAVKVVQSVGDSKVEREGHVLRLAGNLDTETRTATVIIEVTDPMKADEGELPLFPDAFVEIQLEGQETDNVVVIPSRAVESGTAVYILGNGNKLVRQDIQVGWRAGKKTFVTAGLEGQEKVIVSPLANPVEGMELQLRKDTSESFYASEAETASAEDSSGTEDTGSAE